MKKLIYLSALLFCIPLFAQDQHMYWEYLPSPEGYDTEAGYMDYFFTCIEDTDNKPNIHRIYPVYILSEFFHFSLYCLDSMPLLILTFSHHHKVIYPISKYRIQRKIQ